MYKRTTAVILLTLCFMIQGAKAHHCYPNYCRNVTDMQQVPDYWCSIIPIKSDNDCLKLNFKDLAELRPAINPNHFQLAAFLFDSEGSQIGLPLFNLTSSDIDFFRLIVRYQSLIDKKLSTCMYLTLYKNLSYPLPNKFFFSCPLFDEFVEGSPYHLEYFVSGKDYKYSGEFLFIVPYHKSFDEGDDTHTCVPFIYVDILDFLSVILNIQALPEKCNVTTYRIWLINNETGLIADVKISLDEKMEQMFHLHEGVYYFQVAALHPNCSEYGCVNATSPLITMNKASHRLLIMIVSTIWIPPVTLYACYHAYKWYKKKEGSFLFHRLTMNTNGTNCSKRNSRTMKTTLTSEE